MSGDRRATAEVLRVQRARNNDAAEALVEQRLSDVLARVRRDAQTDPQQYARDTEVPEGGE